MLDSRVVSVCWRVVRARVMWWRMSKAPRNSSIRCAAPLSGSNDIGITRVVSADLAQSANDLDIVSPHFDGWLDNPSEIVFWLDLNRHSFTIQPLSSIRVCLTRIFYFAASMHHQDGLAMTCRRKAIASGKSVQKKFCVQAKQYQTRLIPALPRWGRQVDVRND